MNEEQCCAVSEFISVLSNPLRIRILCTLLDGELNVTQIARSVSLPPAHVSGHLRILYDRGYLDRRREWRRVFYSLRRPELRAFLALASDLTSSPEVVAVD